MEFQMEIVMQRYKNMNKKTKIAGFSVLVGVSILFAISIFINIIYFTDDSIRLIVIFLSGAFLAWYIIAPRLFFIPSYVKARLEKIWLKSESVKNKTTDTVKIEGGVLTVAQSNGKILTMPLKTVTGVMQTKNLVLVPLYPQVYEIIPKSIFVKKEEETQFLSALNCKNS